MAIARALINHPKLILADEPTGNLDEANEDIVLSLLRELHAAGHTILVVTHSQSIGRLADRRIEFEHGRLAQPAAALKPSWPDSRNERVYVAMYFDVGYRFRHETQAALCKRRITLHAHPTRHSKKTRQRKSARLVGRGRRYHLVGHHTSHYDFTYLRDQCPCAMCNDEREKKATGATRNSRCFPCSSRSHRARAPIAVGNYALQIDFTDGHATGIFSFEYLREICPCEACEREFRSAAKESTACAPFALRRLQLP